VPRRVHDGSGAERERVDGLIESIGRTVGADVRGAQVLGNVALATNGTTVSGKGIRNPEQLLDGNATVYNGLTGFTSAAFPCEWIVTFDKVYQLQEIHLRLLDVGGRQYRFAIDVSADGTTYTTVYDRSEGGWVGWQRARFDARPVKTIRIRGLGSSSGRTFDAVELEAYCFTPRVRG